MIARIILLTFILCTQIRLLAQDSKLLKVLVNVNDVAISIDGKFIGNIDTGNGKLVEVTVGNHTIMATKNGYDAQTLNVVISRSASIKEIAFVLQKKPITQNTYRNQVSKDVPTKQTMKKEPIIDSSDGYRDDSESSEGRTSTNTERHVNEKVNLDVNLQVHGWEWYRKPTVQLTKGEYGQLVFEIELNENGEITRLATIERSLSAFAEKICREEIQRMTFSPTYEFIPANSKGKVTFTVKGENDTKVEHIKININSEIDESQVYSIVEEQAQPIGGMAAFYKYVGAQMQYPLQAKRMGVEGRVFCEFTVNRDGSIQDVKVIRGLGAGCDEEAMRIIQSAPAWKPGRHRGQAVRSKFNLAIIFKLN